jgi:hypothetical protein
MAESHSASTLKQRRGECLGRLQSIRTKMTQLEASEAETMDLLGHVDALLRKEAPDLALGSIRPRKRREPHPRSGISAEKDGRTPVTQAIRHLPDSHDPTLD